MGGCVGVCHNTSLTCNLSGQIILHHSLLPLLYFFLAYMRNNVFSVRTFSLSIYLYTLYKSLSLRGLPFLKVEMMQLRGAYKNSGLNFSQGEHVLCSDMIHIYYIYSHIFSWYNHIF